MASPTTSNNYLAPLVTMTSLFFLWGLITSLNDILIPHLKSAFSLNYVQAMLIQFCFFGAYFLVSLPAGKLVHRIGYKRGIIIGLCLAAIGCMLFYPSAALRAYWLFLAALFILASGITILQVSANPYVAALGPPRTASSRLNLSQAINSLGHTVGPFLGALLIITAHSSADPANANPEAVQIPYLGLASILLATALVFSFLRLPNIGDHPGNPGPATVTDKTSAWQFKHLLLGSLAIFLYVGAEVSIGSFLVNYISLPEVAGFSEHTAAKYISLYWGGAMVGRFIGAVVTRYVAPTKVLAFNAIFAVLLLLITMYSGGLLSMWSVLAVGLFNSIMFPTIFTLGIRGLGQFTSQGSGILCLAIVGGAILPVLQGVAADSLSVQASFWVPLSCYLFIFWYAVKGAKLD